MTANTFWYTTVYSFKIVMWCLWSYQKCTWPEVYSLIKKYSEEMQEKASEYLLIFGMVQAFGWIDGVRIPLKSPLKDSQDKSYSMDLELKWLTPLHKSIFHLRYLWKNTNRKTSRLLQHTTRFLAEILPVIALQFHKCL